jgi:hypothetical protein
MSVNLNKITEKELEFLPEDVLRKEVVIPLLKKIGCFNVVDLHGTNECGLDIFFEKKDVFRRNKYYGIQCKKGHIKRTTSKNTNSIITICNQINLAFTKQFRNSENNKIYINGFYLVISGQINELAKEYISITTNKLPYLDYIDGQYLISIIYNHLHLT